MTEIRMPVCGDAIVFHQGAHHRGGARAVPALVHQMDGDKVVVTAFGHDGTLTIQTAHHRDHPGRDVLSGFWRWPTE